MSIDTSNGHPDMSYDQHISTYSSFIRLTLAVIIFMALLLAGMAFFLV